MFKYFSTLILPLTLVALFFILALNFLPATSFALTTGGTAGGYEPPAEGEGLVTCGLGDAGPMDCNFAKLLQLIDNVLLFFMYAIIFPISIILIIYAGGTMAWYANTEPAKAKDAKKTLWNILIGFGIVFSATLVVQQLFQYFAPESGDSALLQAIYVLFFRGDR